MNDENIAQKESFEEAQRSDLNYVSSSPKIYFNRIHQSTKYKSEKEKS